MRELRGTGERARVWDQRVGKGRVLVCSKFYRMADSLTGVQEAHDRVMGAGEKGCWEVWG